MPSAVGRIIAAGPALATDLRAVVTNRCGSGHDGGHGTSRALAAGMKTTKTKPKLVVNREIVRVLDVDLTAIRGGLRLSGNDDIPLASGFDCTSFGCHGRPI